MEYPQFIVPEDAEILDALGVEPEASGSDETLRTVRITAGSGESLSLSYDIVGRSVRLQVRRSEGVMVDLFHEGAVQLRLPRNVGSIAIEIDFQTDSTRGELKVQVQPSLSIVDNYLLA